MELIFATHNQHKLEEVKKLFPSDIILKSLNDIGCAEEIPETGKTFEENARIKADYVTSHYALPCFADDSGLLVDALDGAPGVYSARYAGPQKNPDDNMRKLLEAMNDATDRSARFHSVIALNMNNAHRVFKGTVEGDITTEKRGTDGFGYDPIFRPKGYERTFAELSTQTKNSISHRGKAMRQLITYLKQQL
ncbi:non-canonical purine NTP diphosphatase [Flavobacteriaceae bacterium TP-CH-4]|uniref:dITP/XTP pyrophosphatase n=1 Tax=Pelagihabitans pacificus TaxID=2696054 RepID=A0A967ATZ1_9FLAO|nr:non-canonical purine NTP diphosphatase [Pelagihabitans pacificus]NHF59360.1 non-canonical purine NTP diphosphatase [Pelagihabitans pacificus]